MFDAFFAKIAGSDALFDRQFVVAYWSPVLLGVILVLVLGVPFGYTKGLQAVLAPSNKQVLTVDQAFLSIGGLIVITALAYILQALTDTIMRLFEGYWTWAKWLERRLSDWQGKKRNKLRGEWEKLAKNPASQGDHLNRLYRTYYYQYPRSHSYQYPRSHSTPTRPTLLGNILTAAEEYPRLTYGLDGALWWPRLTPLLPSAFQDQINMTQTPMLALLNLAMVLFFVAVLEPAVVGIGDVVGWWRVGQPWWVFVGIAAGGVVLAYVLYRAATVADRVYGNSFRVGFDLYRHELLKQLDVALPKNLVEERELWLKLGRRIYLNRPPLTNPIPSLLPGNGIEYHYPAQDSSASAGEAGAGASEVLA